MGKIHDFVTLYQIFTPILDDNIVIKQEVVSEAFIVNETVYFGNNPLASLSSPNLSFLSQARFSHANKIKENQTKKQIHKQTTQEDKINYYKN
jgi:hypothetical protein